MSAPGREPAARPATAASERALRRALQLLDHPDSRVVLAAVKLVHEFAPRDGDGTGDDALRAALVHVFSKMSPEKRETFRQDVESICG